MDIQIRGQFPAAPGLSVYPDRADPDIWITGQVRGSPDVCCYPTRYRINQTPGPAALSASLGATESPDVAAFTFTITGGGSTLPFTLGATEPQDVASFALKHGFPVTLGVTEAPDVAAFAFTSPVTATNTAAGGKGGKKRRFAFVEIDGITYQVNSVHEARELFEIAARNAPAEMPADRKKRPSVVVIGKSRLAKAIRLEVPKFPVVLDTRDTSDEEEVLIMLMGM